MLDSGKKRLFENIVLSGLILLVSVSFLMVFDWRGNLTDTFNVEKGYFYALPLFFVLMVFAHGYERQDKSIKTYISECVFGRDIPLEKRKYWADYARVIALAGVILTHSCSSQIGEEAPAWRIMLLKLCETFGLVCNPLLIMLSGALLLSSKKEISIGKFYLGRLKKVFLPFFVYYSLLLCMSETVDLKDFSSILAGVKQIFAGATGIAPHYWIIYIFLGLYITAPFMQAMVKAMSDIQIKWLAGVIILSEFITRYLSYTGLTFGISLDFAGWLGVFVLGYIVAERRDAISPYFFIISGAIAFIACAGVTVFSYDYRSLLFNTAPPMVLLSAGIISLLINLEDHFKKRKHSILVTLSKYSFEMLLIHWHIVFVIVMGKFGIQPLRFGCIGGILVTLIASLVMCYLSGFIAENTIIISVRWLFSKKKRMS